MHNVRLLLILNILVLLSGCVAGIPTPTSSPLSPVIVSIDPNLIWIEPLSSACAAQQGSIEILRAEVQSGEPDFGFTLGDPGQGNNFSVLLGFDTVQVINNPENPIQTISADIWQDILIGSLTDWADVACDNCIVGERQIHLYRLPSDSKVMSALTNALSTHQRTRSDQIELLPNLLAMRSSIANDPEGLGVLTARWLDTTVQEIEIAGLESTDGFRIPIIAIGKVEPVGAAREWLLCIQDAINPGDE